MRMELSLKRTKTTVRGSLKRSLPQQISLLRGTQKTSHPRNKGTVRGTLDFSLSHVAGKTLYILYF